MMASSSSNGSKVFKLTGASGEEGECCMICGKNEFLDSRTGGGIEVPCNFFQTLNLVWPYLEETARQTGSAGVEDKRRSENGGGDGCKFAEVPPICKGCADGIQSVQYFKGLSDKHLEQLKKSMKEAKREATSASGASSKEKETTKECMETQKKLEDNQRATLILPWKPTILGRNNLPTLSSSSPDPTVVLETEQIKRTACGILNKLTNSGSKFDTLTFKFVASLPDNLVIKKMIASLIFEKAVKEPFYCPAYARFVRVICKMKRKLKKFILDLCQSQLEKICEEISSLDSSEDEDKRQRCFGIVNFIQELFKFILLKRKFLVSCLDMLLEEQRTVSQFKVECVYKFLAAEKFDGEKFAFGCVLDVGFKGGDNLKCLQDDGWMNKLFENLKKYSKNSQFSGRIRCLLENLVELRENGWRKREKSSGIARKTGKVPREKFAGKPVPPPIEEPALTLWLFERKTRGILNKVNLKNRKLFQKNFFRFLELPYWYCGKYSNNDKQILKAGEMIFEKAVKEPMFCDGYAEIVQRIGQFRKKYPYSINFEKIREVVVERCIGEICKISGDAHADLVEKFGERERILGVVKFIGELYRLKVLSSRNMRTCMQYLIGGDLSEVKMECVCRLLLCKFVNGETREMVYYGEFLDVQLSVLRMAGEEDDEDVRWIKEMFGMVKKFGGDLGFGGRMRCLLANLMELRDNGWKDKSEDVASIAVLEEDKGKKNGGKKKGQRAGVGTVPDGNWRK